MDQMTQERLCINHSFLKCKYPADRADSVKCWECRSADNYYRAAGGEVASDKPDLLALVVRGCEAFYREIFSNAFWDSLDSEATDDHHHTEALTWHWDARVALCRGERPPNDWFAYFPIWSRGNMKTSLLEKLVIADAMISVAFKVPGFCLYIGREKDRVQENISNIESLLSSPQVIKYCPSLSTVARNEETNQKRRWTGTFLHTKADYVFKGATVESAQAGSKIGETRVTLFAPDDIDDRKDSPVIAETRFRLLTTEILPMKQANTLTFFAQNLISRYSVMYRIQKGGARVLTNRKPTEPIPAVRNPVFEQQTVNGIVKDVIVAGRPTWRVWDLQRVQDEIDTYGLPAFKRECQHEVEQDKEGLILYNYDDDVHVISESEFAYKYGKDAWKSWRKKPGNDWARTKTDRHANVAWWLIKSPQSSVLPNITFLRPYSFPADTSPEDVAERLLSELCVYAYKETTWRELRQDVLRRANAHIYTKTDSEKLAFERGEMQRTIPAYSKPLLQRCNVQQGEMSHEADTVRKIYSGVYGLGMRGVNPGKHGGVENFIADLRVDYEIDHPFRPGIKGYTRWFMIAPDDISRPYRNGDKIIYHPKPYPNALMTHDLVDSDLCRFQFSNWRHRDPKLTETGEIIDDPLKLYDDFGNGMQMAYAGHALKGDALTFEQKVDLILPAGVKNAVLAAEGSAMDKLTAQLNYEFERGIAEEKLRPSDDDFEDEWEYYD